MDKQMLRNAFLTQFKPKTEDIATPYLVLPDGTSLDGELRLVGMTGAEGLWLNKACTVNGVLDEVKFTGALIVKCLRMRDEASTPVLEVTDGQNLLAELDLDIVNKLGEQIQRFLGLTPTPLAMPSTISAPSPAPSSTDGSAGTSATPPLADSLSPLEPTTSPDGLPT
jgi:hypothetical protein